MSASINSNWNFPLIRELPLMVKTDGWSWETLRQKRDFWIGTDPQLNSWVVKLCGKLGAVHEHVYAAFAQSLGICNNPPCF
jgi:hypothetical protein